MIIKKIYIGSIQVNIHFDQDNIYKDDEYFSLYEVSHYDLNQKFNVFIREKDLNLKFQKEIYKTNTLRILDNDEFICIENPSNSRCIYYKTYYKKENDTAYIIYDKNFGLNNMISVLSSSQFIYAFLFFIQHKNYLILHSNLLKAKKGILFCGESGKGKTTISKIFDNNGYKVITDETVLIEIGDDQIIGYGTPWAGRERFYFQNDAIKIDTLFIIEHSSTNILREENKIYFANYLLKQSYPFFYISKSIAFQYNKIMKMISLLKNYYILGFVPNSSVCAFVEDFYD